MMDDELGSDPPQPTDASRHFSRTNEKKTLKQPSIPIPFQLLLT